MIQIKTQNIPAEFLSLMKGQAETPEVSIETFKKALESFAQENDGEEKNVLIEGEQITSGEEEEAATEQAPIFFIQALFVPSAEQTDYSFTIEHAKAIPTEEAKQVFHEMKDLEETAAVEWKNEVDQPIVDNEMAESTNVLADTDELIEPINRKETELFVLSETGEMPTETVDMDQQKTFQHPVKETLQSGETKDAISVEQAAQKSEANKTISSKSLPKVVDTVEPDVLENQPIEAPTESVERPAINTRKGQTQETIVLTKEEMVVKSDITVQAEPSFRQVQNNHQPTPESNKVVSREQWVQEVESFVVSEMQDTNSFEKVSTARIQLSPKHLGEMEIELVIQDKELTARLVVEKMETKEWLEQKIMQLTTNLAAQDIKVEQIEVSVFSPQASSLDSSFEDNPFFRQQNQSFQQKHSFHKRPEEEQTPKRSEESNRQYSGRLSLYV